MADFFYVPSKVKLFEFIKKEWDLSWEHGLGRPLQEKTALYAQKNQKNSVVRNNFRGSRFFKKFGTMNSKESIPRKRGWRYGGKCELKMP